MTSIVSGRPARGFTNQFMNEYRDEAENTPAFPVAYDANKAFTAAAGKAGDGRYGTMWAGQGAPMSQSKPAADLIEQLARETTAEINRLIKLNSLL